MPLTAVLSTEKESLHQVQSLLQSARLPVSDLGQRGQFIYVFQTNEQVKGTGGFEVHGKHALIRSVSVVPENRGKGLGREIIGALKLLAAPHNVSDFYLLTTGAAGFFEKLGFIRIERSEAPEPIRRSSEFSAVCPSSAVLMRCPA